MGFHLGYYILVMLIYQFENNAFSLPFQRETMPEVEHHHSLLPFRHCPSLPAISVNCSSTYSCTYINTCTHHTLVHTQLIPPGRPEHSHTRHGIEEIPRPNSLPTLTSSGTLDFVSAHHTLPHYSVSLVQKAVLLLRCLSHSPYQDAKRWHAWTKALRALRSRVKRVYLKLVDL